MKTILVVDDEFANAEVLALILAEEGYSVTCASNGRDALGKIEQSCPDLVIVDYMMPIMDGGALGHAIRAHAQWRQTKIVMQSSLSEAAVQPRWDGYDAFVRKPYNVDALLRIIEQLLGRPQ